MPNSFTVSTCTTCQCVSLWYFFFFVTDSLRITNVCFSLPISGTFMTVNFMWGIAVARVYLTLRVERPELLDAA